MPDTGPPWNIPYVEPTDNPRVYPAASEDLAEAIADGLDAAGNAGIGSNVVQTVKTDTFSTSSTSFVTVTGLSVTITPTSATSKILVVGQIGAGSGNDNDVAPVKITRGATDIYVGDAASTRIQGVFGGRSPLNSGGWLNSYSIVFLDSPDTTSPVTYNVVTRSTAGGFTSFINRSGADTDGVSVRGASSITVIEVEA
jgi:hypothetical protein